MTGIIEVGVENTHAAEKNRHLRNAQRKELGAIDKHFLGLYGVAALEVVPETVGLGLEVCEGFDVGLFLRRVGAPRREGHSHVVTGVLRGLLYARASCEDYKVGE